jgi:hypothetical protein
LVYFSRFGKLNLEKSGNTDVYLDLESTLDLFPFFAFLAGAGDLERDLDLRDTEFDLRRVARLQFSANFSFFATEAM